MRNFLLLMLFVSLPVSGCGRKDTDSKDAVARVNDRTISLGVFESTLGRLGHQPGKDFNSLDGKKELLREMVDEELLFQDAMKADFIRKSDRLRRDIAREYLIDRIGKERYEPSDEEIRTVFEKKKNELEQVRASHILVIPEKPGTTDSERAAERKAASILTEIRKEGAKADFAKYVEKYSGDTGSKPTGDLGLFTRDKMVKEFSDAAFALKKVGDLSAVVRSQFGYHIIKLTGEQRGLDYFRPSIQWQIAQEKQKEKAEKLLTRLRTEARIQYFDGNLTKAGVK
jgi:parvulin-like peptidyl-prolyl isomerase